MCILCSALMMTEAFSQIVGKVSDLKVGIRELSFSVYHVQLEYQNTYSLWFRRSLSATILANHVESDVLS